jgi:hypothetical protein
LTYLDYIWGTDTGSRYVPQNAAGNGDITAVAFSFVGEAIP